MANQTGRPHSNNSNKEKARTATIQENVRQAAQDVGRTVRDLADEKIDNLRDAAGEYIEAGRERASDYVEQGRDVAHQYIERGRDRAIEIERTLEDQIRDQPLKAVLAAAGIGFVLGVFFMRR